MAEKNYTTYSPDEFLQDDYFVCWLATKQGDVNSFWEGWLREHPQKANDVEIARKKYHKLVSFTKKPATQTDYSQVWDAINRSIDISTTSFSERSIRPYRNLMRYAAGFIGLLMILTGGYQWLKNQKTEVLTADKIKNITLPDGSLIVLNAHSKLRFSKYLVTSTEREVWLSGEAFFEVRRKTVNGRKASFIVHASKMDIEVLGTAFNVKARDTMIRVVLNSGKVKATVGQMTETLEPGEMLELRNSTLSKRQVNPHFFGAWRTGQFNFSGTTFTEVISLLEDYYGYQVKVKNSEQISHKTFSGAISNKNEQILLETLSTIFEVKITKHENNLVIQSQNKQNLNN